MANTHELFSLALQFHQKGDLAQAATLYRQLVRAEPAHAGLHNNLGLALMGMGQLAESIACYRQALRLDPQYADALDNLGNALRRQGNLTEAAECCRQALRINPAHAQAANSLGLALQQLGNPSEAIACYLQALAINPQNAGVLNNLATAYLKLRQLTEAIACLGHALRIQPNYAPAHINLGNALKDEGRFVEAAEAYRQALRIDPEMSEAHYNLGNVLIDLNQFAEAAECFRRALRHNPNHADACYNLGNARAHQGLLEEAVAAFRRAVRLQPSHGDAYLNLGNVLQEHGRLEEAAASYRQALAVEATQRKALWNLACLRLLQGDYERGLAGYEQRWNEPGATSHSLRQSRWQGKAMLVVVERDQGLGDTIQFARYLPLVKRRGGSVLLACQEALVSLVARMPGVDRVLSAEVPFPPFDVQFPLLSLLGLCGTTLTTIPAAVPYLTADPKLIEQWRHLLGPRNDVAAGSQLNVGIIWQGSLRKKGDLRSLSLSHFAAVAAVEGVRLVSLQVGPAVRELEAVHFPVIDWGSRFSPTSLEDLAAAMMSLDLVITVDTAAAHLAGALGVPVWTMLQFIPDWRWLLERSDSPWYPTMRLFRQQQFGKWGEVLERVAEEIKKGVRSEE